MLLHTEKLTKHYNGFRALEQLDLTVARGEVFGLLGPNGSGKTTALRLILGYLQPTEGNAWVEGHECWTDGVAARRNLAYLPGELRLYENMTGRQLVRFLSELRGQANLGDVDGLARCFDIDLERPLVQLSSGMKRKVALLQVLAPQVPLVLLDEPTNALDPTMRGELLTQLRKARDRGQGVLFSSHVLSEVEQVCDRVGILQKGKLVHLQKMEDLRRGKRIRVRLDKPVEEIPKIEGLSLSSFDDLNLTLDLTGPLPPLLGWLASQPVADLQIEPLGLNVIYQRYHGAAA